MSVPDILAIAVHGANSYLSDSRVPPVDSLTIRWILNAHPCDGHPYLFWINVRDDRCLTCLRGAA